MSDERNRESQPPSALPTVQSPNFRIIYANGFSYKPTLADFGLTAIVTLPITQNIEGNLITSEVAMQEVMIMLSLASAKALAKNLTVMVGEIEKEYGQIRVPRGALISDEQLRAVANNFKLAPLEDS
jgi:hypothetical protein